MASNFIESFTVGQEVTPLIPLGDAPSGDSPGGIYAEPGERLIVREVRDNGHYPIVVSHEDVTDNGFGVKPSEIEALS